MPTDPSTTDVNTDFVLKHRVAGAAFLLFFGALVLPWVLGPPNQPNDESNGANNGVVVTNLTGTTASSATESPTRVASDKSVDELSAQSIENELLSTIDDELLNTPESVYISKITPADGKKDTFRESPTNESANSASTIPTAAVSTPKPVAKKTVVKKEVDSKPLSDIVKNAEPKLTTSSAPRKAVNTAATNTVEKSTQKSDIKPQTVANTVDVGWVVQVGVFTDKAGASKVVNDLSSKGFKASTTIVDTNRGKGTGTRVWLGPFAQRVEAAKTKARLTERTGEPGFIRAYP